MREPFRQTNFDMRNRTTDGRKRLMEISEQSAWNMVFDTSTDLWTMVSASFFHN